MGIKFEIITPAGVFQTGEADLVVMPAKNGYLGAAEGHIPFATLLSSGAVTIYNGDIKINEIYVTGGIAEILPEKITLLVDEASVDAPTEDN